MTRLPDTSYAPGRVGPARSPETPRRWPEVIAALTETDAPCGEAEPLLDLLRTRLERRT